MASTFTTLLRLANPSLGDTGWGTTVSNGMINLVDSAIAGTTTLSTDADVTLTTSNGVTDQSRQMILNCTGSRAAQRTITAPASSKVYVVINGTTGGFGVKIVGVGPTTGVVVPNGCMAVVAWNGTDFVTLGAVADLTVSGNVTLSALTASTVLALDVNKQISSATTTGTGNVVLSDAPTFTGTTQFAGYTTSADVEINGIDVGRGGGNSSSNTVVGNNAFSANTSGVNCSAIGSAALNANTTGTSNTAVGNSCLISVNTGSSNTAVGSFSGGNITSGSSNTTIGWNAQTSAAGSTSQVVVGAALIGKGDNTAFIGGTSGAYNAKNVTTWETTSDLRLKKDVTDNKEGLEHILAIRIRNFKYRTQEEITELPIESAVDKQGVQLGVIAQEIQQILPQLVTENSTGVLSLNTDPLLWYLINSVQSLKEELNQAKARIDALEST